MNGRMSARHVTFAEGEGTVIDSPSRSREWRVKQTVSGWRLAFRDEGDDRWTNAGLFKSMADAAEAVG